MLIHHTTNDPPRRPARDDIWLDDEQDEDLEEVDLETTAAGLIAQLGLKGLPDDSY